MSFKAAEIKKLLAISVKYGVKSLKVGEFEVHFSEEKPKDNSSPILQTKQPIGMEAGMPTEDELLFYSTNYDPNIKATPPEAN